MNRLTVAVLLLAFVLAVAPVSARAQDYHELTPLLIDLQDWSADPAEGMNMDMGAYKMINVVRSYARDSKELEAIIVIGNQIMPQGPMETMHAESDDSVMNMRQIDGFKVYTVHDKQDNSGNVSVFLVQKEPQSAMFAISYQGISESEAMDLARQFNWNEMKLTAATMF